MTSSTTNTDRSAADTLATVLRNGAIAVTTLALLIGSLVPVYTDEVGWRFQERAGFDGVDKLFSETCGLNTLGRPAFFMWPVRYYSSFFNGLFPDPVFVRISGVLYAAAFMVLLAAIVVRACDTVQGRKLLLALALGLLGLGMLPWLIVWSRPEQPILLCLGGAVYIGLATLREQGDTPRATAWRRALVIALLWGIAVSYHLKALFHLPAYITAIWFCARGRDTANPRVAAGAILTIFTTLAVTYWFSRMACPDDPVLNRFYAYNNISAQFSSVRTWDDVLAILKEMWKNSSVYSYVVLSAPEDVPMSRWLPAGRMSEETADTIKWMIAVLWSIAMLAALVGVVRAISDLVKRRRIDRRVIFAAGFAVSVTGWRVTQNDLNIYEATFILPVVVLGVVLLLATVAREAFVRTGLLALGGLFLVAQSANLLTISLVWGPSMVDALGKGAYLREQPVSVPLTGYPRERILQTARMCHMPPPERARAVLIDDVTYFAYMRSTLPQHHLGVLSMWRGQIDDPVAYLKSRGSDGMIVGCRFLKGDLRERATRNGEFCCLAPPNW